MSKLDFPRAIIFDLDGTLIDSAPDLCAAVNRLLIRESRRELSLAEVSMMLGDGVPKLVERAFAATGKTLLGTDLLAAIEKFAFIYHKNSTTLTKVYPGAVEVLNNLRDKKIKLSICTNKPYSAAKKIIFELELEHYFETIVGGDSLGGVKKPDVRHLMAALGPMNVKVNSTLMVGDSVNDIKCAKNLGMKSVVVSFGYSKIPVGALGADAVIYHFDELIDIFDSL